MQSKITSLTLLFTFSICFSQSQNLIGKWILVKTLFDDGRNIEINNPNYSTKLVYTITPKKIRIINQNFDANFTSDKIKTQFRTINYSIKEKYLIAKENGDNKTSYFLKSTDFVEKFPEFSLKKAVRNNDTIYIANDISDYSFENELDFEEFIYQNRKEKERSSKSFNNLYFEIEFILTNYNKIKDIKVVNSIDTVYDNDYISALKKSEKYLKNLTGKDLLITKEVNHLKWANDLSDNEERKLYKLRSKGMEYYQNNNFEKAIEQFSQIESLNIKNNRFKTLIKESLINLGISYLAVDQNENACKTFTKIGNKTDFEIRNYLIDFCEKK